MRETIPAICGVAILVKIYRRVGKRNMKGKKIIMRQRGYQRATGVCEIYFRLLI
jgi:hypothetical protein